MKVTTCAGPSCGRPYQVNRFSDSTISAAPGKITCPHCGTVSEGEPTTVFMTHALSAAEEADYKTPNEDAAPAADEPDAAAAVGEPPQD